jgi:energy-coupling factor transporter ATP-binding protein EcfA2
MQLQFVRIANYRCIRDAVIRLDSATAFVGGNGSGKSTVLRAIDAFYTPNPGITIDDFYNRVTNVPIEIELTFHNFSAAERRLFASKIEGDRMSVVRVFDNGTKNGRYFGSSLQHDGFDGIRAQTGVQKRSAYNNFSRENAAYALPTIRTVAEVDPALEAWETLHPAQCQRRRDDGQWFGFTNNANGKLHRATNFVFVPAVRDAAAESGSGRAAAVSRLMDLVVRSAIENRVVPPVVV